MPDYFEYAAATEALAPAPAQIPDATPAADASPASTEAVTDPSGTDGLGSTPSDKQEMDSSALADIFSASFGTQVTVHEVDARD
jgi:hypothetical protein